MIDRRGAPDVAEIVSARVRACAGHPALLCYALGNEVPAQIVRWLGPRGIGRYLERLYRIVKAEDPDGLVTYVNYPTTDYLRLQFLGLVCFNVYLESRDRFEAYLARLHNLAGDRPLVLSELSLESLRNGEHTQARVLDWQVRAVFASGAAGTFVFAWTDERYGAGEYVDDWRFGLTGGRREPKPALGAVRTPTPRRPSRPPGAGRASRSSSARTTAPGPSATASTVSSTWTTRTSRSSSHVSGAVRRGAAPTRARAGSARGARAGSPPTCPPLRYGSSGTSGSASRHACTPA